MCVSAAIDFFSFVFCLIVVVIARNIHITYTEHGAVDIINCGALYRLIIHSHYCWCACQCCQL